ncbi:MmpS family transport accessory protein [Planotetraspora sp. A-T 1434]|uniref:MmpS family transport accessory protein n=1 Tax=Planotetraspora sp. A-T 1434 TaxID=2979219 RepID=UPI0021BEF99D|nr:MmpS family transport accessory protein [Planotetraspora sp. A-T 1434]MCT9933517.1 MmpS family transport accessory protein [Planotetraspora sp. A-T 1434]
MAYQQGPQDSGTYSAPYGYQPAPPPPPKGKSLFFWVMVIAVPLLLLGGGFAVVVGAASEGANEAQKAISDVTPPARRAHTVVFEAEGYGGATKAGNVAYSVALRVRREADVPLPYTKTIKVADPESALSLWARNGNAEGTVTCRIKVDGRTVRQDTAKGPYRACRVQASSLN